jgi:hypothetical protein
VGQDQRMDGADTRVDEEGRGYEMLGEASGGCDWLGYVDDSERW